MCPAGGLLSANIDEINYVIILGKQINKMKTYYFFIVKTVNVLILFCLPAIIIIVK